MIAKQVIAFDNSKKYKPGAKKGLTRIRTGVVRIKTESDNHYTIKPQINFSIVFFLEFQATFAILYHTFLQVYCSLSYQNSILKTLNSFNKYISS